MNEWVRVARVLRTKSLEGSVVCCAADGLPFLLEEGLEVRFVPPTLRGPRAATVAEVCAAGSDSWEVRFEGIDSIGEAEQVVGCTCLAPAGSISSHPVRTPFDHAIGCTLVEATAGEVGVIVEVRPGPAQSLLVVETPDGRQVLVPAVDAFLGPVDAESRQLHATLPPGLLDL